MRKLKSKTPLLTDTQPEVETVQLTLFRQASVAQRLRLLCSLSQTAIQLSRRALLERQTGGLAASLAFVTLNYGAALAERLSEHLSSRYPEEVIMNPPDILAALSPVIDVFEHLRIAYHIGGSLASSAHGIPRTTVDIDLVADLRAEHVAPLVEQLREAYYVDEQMIHKALARRGSFNLIHLATMLKVDVFLPKERPFDREAACRAAPHALDEAADARTFYLASAEDVILTKLEWYRAGGEVSERQWNDVLGVMKVKAQALDFVYLERWAEQLDLADLLARALTEAAINRQ